MVRNPCIGIVGILSFLISTVTGMEVNRKPPEWFDVPGGGRIQLPGRFFVDRARPEAFAPHDLLLVYGKRRSTLSGFKDISEAVAVGRKDVYGDWIGFQKQAAHYLNDAEWRGPAREDLEWRTAEVDGVTVHTAGLGPSPAGNPSDRLVVVAAPDDRPVWAVAFVKKNLADGMDRVLVEAVQSFQSE